LENYVLPQLNNTNHILQLVHAPVHFSHIFRYCLDVKFSDRWIEEGQQFRGPVVLLNIFKGHAHSQTVNTPDELNASLQ
jgi:hypothetical protein